MKKEEILQRLKNARTWKEAEVSMKDVIDLLIGNETVNESNDGEESPEIRRLKRKVERLTESNKQLMAENKKLKGDQ